MHFHVMNDEHKSDFFFTISSGFMIPVVLHMHNFSILQINFSATSAYFMAFVSCEYAMYNSQKLWMKCF